MSLSISLCMHIYNVIYIYIYIATAPAVGRRSAKCTHTNFALSLPKDLEQWLSIQRSCSHGAPERALAALHESSLALEDREGLLEAVHLGLTTSLAILIRLRLGDATLLDLAIVIQDGGEF